MKHIWHYRECPCGNHPKPYIFGKLPSC